MTQDSFVGSEQEAIQPLLSLSRCSLHGCSLICACLFAPAAFSCVECVSAMAIGARWSGQQCEATPLQRKKTASERRAQRLRAEGRRIQHALSALNEVHSHRGGQLTKFGYLLREAFMQLKDPSTQRAIIMMQLILRGHIIRMSIGMQQFLPRFLRQLVPLTLVVWFRSLWFA